MISRATAAAATKLSRTGQMPIAAEVPGPETRAAEILARVQWACTGLRPARVAEITGANHETVRRYLRGKSEPSSGFLAALSAGLGLAPEWLLHGIGEVYVPARPATLKTSFHSNKEALSALIEELSRRVQQLP